MHRDVSRKTVWRLVSAGTLLVLVGAVGLSTARAQQGGSILRRSGGGPAQRTMTEDDYIRQILGEDEGAPEPPPGGKIPVEGEPGAPEPPGATPPAEEAKAEEPAAAAAPAPWGLTDLFDDDAGGNWFKENQWKFGGNIDQSFTLNFQSPRDRFNGPVTWTDRSNDYQLNQLWWFAERATDTSKKDWDFGGRFDIFFGSNSRFDTETGLEDNNINGGQAFYGIAIPQFYLEAAYKKLKVKMGHFISPVGYFTVDMTQNFFNTLPYTFQYGEPFTHTGLLATYTPSDKWAFAAGMVRGWDNFDSSGVGTSNLAAIASATYTWKDKSSFYWFMIWSNEPNGFGTDVSSRYLQTMVYSKPLTDKLNYVLQSDLGIQANTNNAVGGGTSRWYGVNQYLYYVQNERWTWGFNFEWFRDEEGFRVGGFLPIPPATPANSATRGLPTNRVGYVGNFFQWTMGPKWQFHKNMFLRPNLRFDLFNGVSTTGLKPFSDGNKDYQTILGTDLVILF